MKFSISGLVVAGFLAVLLGAGCSVPSKQATSPPIRIGSFMPLSGDLAFIGQELQRGAEIAKAELEEVGGVRIEYVSEDDLFKPAGSVQAVNKLLNIDKVDAVFTPTLAEAQPVLEQFRGKDQPLLVAWDSNKLLKEAEGPVFSIGFSTEENGKKMADYAYQDLGLRRVAVLQHIDDFSTLIANAFETHFKELGGQIVLSEKRPVDEKDYRTFLSKVKQGDVKAIYFPLIPPGNARFLMQAKQLDLRVRLLGADALLADEIQEAGSASEGVYYTNIFSEQPEMITRKYKERFNADPVDPNLVAFGYDSMMVLFQAVNKAHTEGVSVAEALTQADVFGAGSHIKMNGTRFSERIERIYQVKNGVPELVKE